MKKLSLKVAVVVAFVAVAGYGVYSSQKSNTTMSELALANVEALAGSEGATPCGGPKTYGTCQSTNTVNCKDLSGCQ